VVNIHTIKPLDKELIAQCAEKTGLIVTAEEHSVIGGLGSAVAETVTEMYPVPVVKIGVNDEYGHSGPAVDLLKEFGLSAENIVKTVKESMNLKK
ncbi:MAG: transketolase family protein, partial [Ruminococcus sp.]|nr:transketolase family protein [Ruminococcus sp.]